MAERDISRLPRWAQARISVAEMREKEAQAELAAYFGDAPTNTVVVRGIGERPLPHNAYIRFKFGAQHINVRVEREGIYINGSTGLRIRPVAINVVVIALEEY